MHTQVLIVAAPGRGPRIECVGGVAARRTAPDAVHLVSTAATPLGGDTIDVRVVVEAGARLRVRSVAAMMVLPGATTTRSRSGWDLEVAGELDVDPGDVVQVPGLLVLKRNHAVVELPLGLAEPLSVAVVAVTGVAAKVATVGGIGAVNERMTPNEVPSALDAMAQ